jgi:FlaA1/EpsC-like NDP-sugar epimerase
VKHLSLLDIAESGLHELALDLDRDSDVARDPIVGDICDAPLLTDIFKRHRPQIVLHAAACKHVSLMEENPFAAARTNVLGTQQVAQVASAFGADRMILISTDKAVSPIGIMGATKRIAELVVLANRGATRMNAVRLGNVLGSTGSVVPTLQRQIAQGGPITITDAACTRYFVSINEAYSSYSLCSSSIVHLLSSSRISANLTALSISPGFLLRMLGWITRKSSIGLPVCAREKKSPKG